MRRIVLAAIVAPAILTACTQHEVGILEGIELERAIIDDGDLGNELNVRSVGSTSGYIFAAAGDLYVRASAEAVDGTDIQTQWSAVSGPGTETNPYQANAVATLGGTVYAGFANLDGDESGIYPVDLSGADATNLAETVSLGPPVVTQESAVVGGSTEAPVALGRIFVVSDGTDERLFVSVRAPGGAYHVYHTRDAAAFTELSVPAALAAFPLNDVAHDGSRFWFLTSRGLFVSSDLVSSSVVPDADPGPSVDQELSGLTYGGLAGGHQLWVATRDGFLYSAVNGAEGFGGTWNVNTAAHTGGAGEDDPLAFTDFALVSRGSEDELVVGTVGFGYRQVGANATVALTTPPVGDSNYDASALSRATILTFHVSPARTDIPVPTGQDDEFVLRDGDILFAGTAELGLWKALYSHDGPEQWQRE